MLLNTYPHLHTYKCTYAHTYVCTYLHIYKQVNLQAALHSTHVFTYIYAYKCAFVYWCDIVWCDERVNEKRFKPRPIRLAHHCLPWAHTRPLLMNAWWICMYEIHIYTYIHLYIWSLCCMRPGGDVDSAVEDSHHMWSNVSLVDWSTCVFVVVWLCVTGKYACM